MRPELQTREMIELLGRASILKEEFFIYLSARVEFENNSSKHTFTEADMFCYLKKVEGGKCYTLTLPGNKFESLKLRYINGAVMVGKGMINYDPELDHRYHWKEQINQTGLRVYFHKPGARIYPRYEDKYHYIAPGKRVTFKVKVKKTNRLGEPYGKCTKQNPFIRNTTQNVYTGMECRLMCRSSQYLEQTGRVYVFLPLLDNMF